MQATPRPTDEGGRLRALLRRQLLDTPPDNTLEDLIRLARQVTGTPAAFIGLIDDHRQWVKAGVGPVPSVETGRKGSLCEYALGSHEPVIIPDTLKDARCRDNPFFSGDAPIRSCAAIPLTTPSGHILGALCVLDKIRRTLESSQVERLREIAQDVVRYFEEGWEERLRNTRIAMLQRIARAGPLAELCAYLAKLVEDLSPGLEASVALVRREAVESVVGLPAEFALMGKGPQDLEPISIADLLSDPCPEPVRALAQEFSVRSYWSRPILSSSEEVLGAVALSSGAPGRPAQEDVQVLRLAASLAGLAVERSRKQEALRECQEEFRLFFAHSSVAVAQADPMTGRLLRVNRAFCDLLHYDGEELLERTFGDITHPDDRDRDLAEWRTRMQSDDPHYRAQKRYLRKDGSSTWVDATMDLIRDGEGRPLRMLAVIQDITAQKDAERKLRESEERLRVITTAMPQLVWACSTAGACTFQSIQWETVTGQPVDESLGSGWLKMVHPSDRPRIAEAWRRATALGTPYQTEYRLWNRQGGYRWFLARAEAVRDSAGTALSWIGTSTDIDETKQAQKALRESEERFAGIVNLALDAIITVDHEHRIVVFNPAAERMFRCPASEALGAPVERFIPLRFRDAHHAHLDAFGSHGMTARPMGTSGELTALRSDGEEFPIEASISRLEHSTGALMTVVLRDITERKRHEEALRRWNDELELRVQARTEALVKTQDRLTLAATAGRLGTFDWNAKTDTNLWSDELLALYGMTREEFGGRKADGVACVVPEDRDRVLAAIARSLDTGHVELDFRIRRRDDRTLRWMHGRWQVFYDEAGKPARMIGLNIAITDRKLMEEDLRISQERLRALAAELNLAEQRERSRLATELHDHLQQMLVLGKLKVGQSKRLASSLPACVDLMKQVDEVLSEALTYTRTLTAELSPPVLRERGLAGGLVWLGQYMKKHDMAVTVQVPDSTVTLPEDLAVLLFQSVRELLINSSKHAGTGEATVTLDQRDGRLRITISDEGAGFDLAAAAAAAAAASSTGGLSSKFGLFSIRERMKALGGSFDIQSAPGQGTTATLTLPLGSRSEPGSMFEVRSPRF